MELIGDPDDPGGPGSWRIARQVAPDRVVSTVDPEARHAHKTVSRRQDGFKAHVVVEPDTGLVTGCALTAASGPTSPDGPNGLRLLGSDPTVAAAPVEVPADSAYGTGAVLAALTDAGHVATIKPWPLRQPIPGGFTAADFAVHEQARTVTCPAGQTTTFTAARRVAAGGVRCADCPLRARCTTSPRGRKVVVHPHDRFQRAHRDRMADPTVAADHRRHRPMVERSLAWLTRGNRKLRYRGIVKNNAWLHLRVAAINLRRLLTLTATAGQPIPS